MSYHLVTGVGHELESMVLEDTGDTKDGYVRVGIGGDFAWVIETDLTEITYDDYFTILAEAAYGKRDRLNDVYRRIADETS